VAIGELLIAALQEVTPELAAGALSADQSQSVLCFQLLTARRPIAIGTTKHNRAALGRAKFYVRAEHNVARNRAPMQTH
jgi:hypothetical protein